MVRAVLLYNPAAGRLPLSERRLKRVREILYIGGITADLIVSDPHRDPSLWLNLEGRDLLIVYGGDGTLHQVMPEVVGRGIPVGLLPAGTANVLARELGIPADLERALTVVGRQKRRRICLGQSGPHYFHLMAGVGFDGCVLSNLSLPLKRRVGIAAYWLATAIGLLRCPLTRFEVRVDGESLHGSFAVISNVSRYGGPLKVTPFARPEEASLDVCVLTSCQRWRLVGFVLGVVTGRHLGRPDVLYRKAVRVELEAGNDVPVQMDGEVIGFGSMQFEVAREGLEVIVP